MIIGSHVSLAGSKQFLGSVKEAISYQANALMVYTGAPQNTFRKPVSELRIIEAHELLESHQMKKDHIIVHAPYIVNLANPSQEKRYFAIDFLSEEVRRTAALGSRIMVLHPGAHLGQESEKGIELIAEGIQKIIHNTSHLNVRITLEGMAGKGTEIGRSFDELHRLLKAIGDPSRTGICLDTCHTHDAGYDIINDFDGVLHQFDEIVGLDNLVVIHVNDSQNVQRTKKDRHANIGFGNIGFSVIHAIVHHPKLSHIPKLLETPYIPSTKHETRSYPPYRFEIEMLRLGKFREDLPQQVRDYYEEEIA